MSLTLRHIRYFIATAEAGQVSQAAAILAISQSAVTTAIKELEEDLAAPLFDRTPHGMDLTAAGRRFLAYAYEILQKVDEATHFSFETSAITGTLKIAATYTVMGYFLPSHIERLRRLHPGIEIKLYELSRESIEEGLVTGRYDIAIMLTSNIWNPDVTTEKLLSSQRRLWVPARHPLLFSSSVGLKDVAEYTYIMLTIDEASHTSMKYWSQTPYLPSVSLRTTSIEAVRSLVANGQGITILSDMVHRPWSLEGRRIETVTLTDAVPSMDIGLVWRRNTDFNPAMEAYRSYFRRAFNIPQ